MDNTEHSLTASAAPAYNMASPSIFRGSVSERTGPSAAVVVYGLEQLARRAGVTEEALRRWRIDWTQRDYVTVFIQPGTRKRVRFPRASGVTWDDIQASKFRVSIAEWMPGAPPKCESIPDFRVPFSSSPGARVGALFAADSPESFTCAVDLPLAATLTLARYEETFPAPRDTHGRFPASSSIAFHHGFLHRPIVDEYGLALEQVLERLLPAWRPSPRSLRVKISHDVDEIGVPFSLRGAAAKTLRHGRPFSTLRDLAAPIFGVNNTYQSQLKRLVRFSVDRDLDCSVHWKASKRGLHDTGYRLSDPAILGLVHFFRERSIEMGIHPSYETFESPQLLRSEVATLRDFLGDQRTGGRQDYLRWSPPSWSEWDAIGISYDSSVGFADQTGFRAGTCIPYRPWLWREQREANLIEIPLLAMDSMLRGYMKAAPGRALAVLRELIVRCRSVGGVFTLAWHNTSLFDSGYTVVYRAVLDELAGTPKYDWRAASA